MGILIFLNFVVIFWFGYRSLKDSVETSSEVSVNAKVIGLAAAFVTFIDLYSFALKAGRPELLAYGLVVLFYILVVPFMLVRLLGHESSGIDDPTSGEKLTAIQALKAMELVVWGLVACAAAVIVCSLYFVLLNEGIRVGGENLVPAFVRDGLQQTGRTEFWGFSPGILGIAWLPAVFLTATTSFVDPPAVFGLDRRGKAWLLAGAAITSIVLSWAMIDIRNLAPGLYPVSTVAALGLKAGLAILILAAFLAAYAAARAIDRRRGSDAIASLVGLVTFFAGGALVGLCLVGLKSWSIPADPALKHLVWMHGLGFALAFASGRCALYLLGTRRSDIAPRIGGEA